jgi:hypothetical protein
VIAGRVPGDESSLNSMPGTNRQMTQVVLLRVVRDKARDLRAAKDLKELSRDGSTRPSKPVAHHRVNLFALVFRMALALQWGQGPAALRVFMSAGR